MATTAATTPRELSKLRERLLRALYVHPNALRARVSCRLLKRAIDGYEHVEGTVLGRDCLALIAEARLDYSRAITHRTHQLDLLEKVVREARRIEPGDTRTLALRTLASDRSTVLAFLTLSLWSVGQLDSALETISEMRLVCARYGLAFWGRGIQVEIQRELKDQKDKMDRDRPVTRVAKVKARRQLIVAQATSLAA